MLYILSIASVLSQCNDVTFLGPGKLDVRQVEKMFPLALERLNLKPTVPRPRLPMVSECARAVLNTRFGTVIVQSSYVPAVRRFGGAFLVCEFPFQKEVSWRNRLRLKTYRVVANSQFTAGWIQRRWGKEAQVLYPPVFAIKPLAKEPWILGVGRFVNSKRSKRQVEMIGMFRELVAAGLNGWSLHLAGSVGHGDYARVVTEAAKGLPVSLHFNISRAELEALYGKASIFWHATGVGVDAEANPELMEHFGITTAEAMSAGCVPVVINGGGQPEIVTPRCGLLWNTLEDCAAETLELTRDPDRMKRLSASAVKSSERFSFPAFARRTEEIFVS